MVVYGCVRLCAVMCAELSAHNGTFLHFCARHRVIRRCHEMTVSDICGECLTASLGVIRARRFDVSVKVMGKSRARSERGRALLPMGCDRERLVPRETITAKHSLQNIPCETFTAKHSL